MNSIPMPKFTLYERKDIEILISFILSKIGKMTKDELISCTVDHDFVNYFDMICCIIDLEEKGVIKSEVSDGTEIICPTSQSDTLAIELSYSLPLSIREDTVYYAKKITAHSHLEKAAKCEIVKLSQGYHLCIRFINEMGGADLMELKIYAPTYEAAEQMEKRFFDNPAGAYRSVLNSFIQGYLTVSESEIIKTLKNNS